MPRLPEESDINFIEDPKAYDYLVAEAKRTGVGGTGIEPLVKPCNPRLHKKRIENIMAGKIKFPSKSEYDALIRAYDKLPTIERIDLSSEMIEEIQDLMDQKDISISDISKALRRSHGVSVCILRNWLSGETKTAKRTIYEGVKGFLKDK